MNQYFSWLTKAAHARVAFAVSEQVFRSFKPLLWWLAKIA